MWFLLACAEPRPASTGATPAPAPAPAPAPDATSDSGLYGYRPVGATPLTAVVTSSESQGGSGTYSYAEDLLTAVAIGSEVGLERIGATEGCGCEVELKAWLFADEGRIGLQWDSGSCDGVFGCAHSATLSGVPSGAWLIDEYWGDLSTQVVVP